MNRNTRAGFAATSRDAARTITTRDGLAAITTRDAAPTFGEAKRLRVDHDATGKPSLHSDVMGATVAVATDPATGATIVSEVLPDGSIGDALRLPAIEEAKPAAEPVEPGPLSPIPGA